MPGALVQGRRLSWRDVAAIVVWGPFLGGFLGFAIVVVSQAGTPNADFGEALIAGLIAYLVFGWLLGVVPALAAALVWFAISPAVAGPVMRVLATLVIGALASAALLPVAITMLMGSVDAGWPLVVYGIIGGAIALSVVANLCDRRAT